MSSTAPPVELDFLGLRSNGAAEHHHSSGGASSIRGMETRAIARIDPQLLRRVVIARPPPAAAAAAPMTVFYNGSVAIFHVSHNKAEAIMQMAADVNRRGRDNATLVENFSKDVPLARTKSLQQFLVKRKERLTLLGPSQLVAGHGAGTVGAAATGDEPLRVKEEDAAEEEA